MYNPLWLSAPVILYVGFVTSYTDIRYGKIKNRTIVYGLIGAFASILIWFINLLISQRNLSADLLIQTIANILIALVLGVLFWLNEYWSAADAKLYLVFAMLVPIVTYQKAYINYFPSANILLNAFIPATIVYSIQMAKQFKFNHLIKTLNELKDWKKLKMSILSIFIIQWIIQLVFRIFGIESSLLITFMMIFGITPFFMKYITGNMKVTWALVVARVLFDKTLLEPDVLIQFMTITLVYMLIRTFLMALTSEVFSNPSLIKDLKKGDILVNKIVEEDGKYIEVSPKSVQAQTHKELIESTAEGLTDDDIKLLKKMERKSLLTFGRVRLSTHTCFAPYLFLGALLTLITQGNIVTFIYSIF